MANKPTADPPVIDERIEFKGASFLRQMTTEALGELEKVIVIQDGSQTKRLAVLMPYAQYLDLQKAAGL